MEVSLGRPLRTRLEQFVILTVFVLLLEYAARSGAVESITLAPPSEMVVTMIELFATGEITSDFLATAGSTFAAFFLAVLVGIPIGWALWNWGTLQDILDPYLVTLYAMPIFAFYPLLIAIFGFNKVPIILIAFVLAIIAIVINTANGFGQVKEVYGKLGKAMNLSRVSILRQIYLPAATPYIFTGLKLGFIYSLIGVIASEFILANSGLGFLVAFNYQNFATQEMYAVMLTVILIAVTTNTALRRIENRLYQRSAYD